MHAMRQAVFKAVAFTAGGRVVAWDTCMYEAPVGAGVRAT